MTEETFHDLERYVAALLPPTPMEHIWQRYGRWAMQAVTHVDRERVCIESTSWGWRITAPIIDKAWAGTLGAQQELLDGIACLDEAVELCHRLGIHQFIIRDAQTADTL